jgi:REP element-mobilizing transposase RayT
MEKQKNIRFMYNAFLKDEFRFTENNIEFLISLLRKELNKEINKVEISKNNVDYLLELIEKVNDIEIGKF